VIGRLLEHSRVFYFENEGTPEVFLSSADWMGRNFFSRIEVCFPVAEKRLRDRVVKEGLEMYLHDTARAWELQSDGSYIHVRAGKHQRDAQQQLLEQLSEFTTG
jgi:polyphosphate kinase